MVKINLSKEEIIILQNFATKSPVELIRLKSQTVLLRSREILIKHITLATKRSNRTVSRWIKNYSEQKLSSIFSGHTDNENAAKLTRGQKEEIKKVVGQPPNQYGIPVEFWDVPKLKKYVSAEFGVVYESEQSYHFLLKFSGLSLKYPDVVSPRRDEEAIKKRVKEIREEIKPLLENDDWIVFTSDETRLQLEAEIRRAWLVKGRRTVVKTERSNTHQNYLGFLDQKTHICQVFEIKRGNSKETIRVLEELLSKYPKKRVCVIWDNASWHKSKKIREKLKTGQSLEKIHLIALPPYAPETNPIEHVWGYAKAKIANRSNKAFKEIKQAFLQLTHQRKFAYQM